MSEPIIPPLKGRVKMYVSRFIDYSWYTSLVLTFGFGAFIVLVFAYGLAINYKLIGPPPILCHDMIGDPNIKEISEQCMSIYAGYVKK